MPLRSLADAWSALRARLPAADPQPLPEEAGGALCYFLVCFKSTEFVAFLLASLFREGDVFIVHVDRKAPDALKRYVAALAKRHRNILLLPAQDYSWAGFSHVAVTLEAMATAVALPTPWHHFVCLSEQHLPLKSPDAIAAALAPRRSLLAMRPMRGMIDGERADMENRFGAVYRELPAVGCFAVAPAERAPGFLESVHHGTNWMVLHRDHCRALDAARMEGWFSRFSDVVHAEETAIQTLIARFGSEVEPVDAVLVAWPHLTDNHSLVMTEPLFRSAIETDTLFIRKRPNDLTAFERDWVTGNHFRADIYDLRGPPPREAPRPDRRIAAFARAFTEHFPQGAAASGVSVQILDPAVHDPCPPFYVVLRSARLRHGLSVRVVSGNLTDFKVSLSDETVPYGPFTTPFVADGCLHATFRVKIVGLFAHRDILPLDIPDGGFVSIRPGQPVDPVIAMAARMIEAAARLPG